MPRSLLVLTMPNRQREEQDADVATDGRSDFNSPSSAWSISYASTVSTWGLRVLAVSGDGVMAWRDFRAMNWLLSATWLVGTTWTLVTLIAPATQGQTLPPSVDPARLSDNRIRAIVGDRLTLYTDLPVDPSLESLPQVFAAAIPQWEAYFNASPPANGNWRMRGYLMQEPDRFKRAGLFPDDLPPFPHGYQRGDEFWLYDQPSDYYRRHLVLHEGTHGYAFSIGADPLEAWAREGIAERLATHKWDGTQLTLGWYPATRDQVPYWGRLKMLQDEIGQSRALSLNELLHLSDQAFRRAEAYAWTWAVTLFLDRHPLTAQAFTEFRQTCAQRRNSMEALHSICRAHAGQLEDDWYLFVRALQYGREFAPVPIRAASSPLRDVPADGTQVVVEAAGAWQSSGLRLRAGQRYTLEAHGRYSLAQQPRPWWSEPEGVTIDYVDGRPLGQLLWALAPLEQGRRAAALQQPNSLGSSGTLQPEQEGELFFRINEHMGDLQDNKGTLEVTIKPVTGS